MWTSFHTTISLLERLLEYERAGRKSAAITRARKAADCDLLERAMVRTLPTGDVIDKRWLGFAFPLFWHDDVLLSLDYFRNAGFKPDSRVGAAVQTVIERRRQYGRWTLNLLHPEHIALEMEPSVGSANRRNRLRAVRVLRRQMRAGCWKAPASHPKPVERGGRACAGQRGRYCRERALGMIMPRLGGPVRFGLR